MNSSNILFIAASIAFCCINFSQSTKCLTCDTKDSCLQPKCQVCNKALAEKTKAYLDFHHKDVNMGIKSSTFLCFREHINSSSGEYYYKGCEYSKMAGCSHPLKGFHNGHVAAECIETSGNGCNPAGRPTVNLLGLLAATIVGALVTSRMVS